MYAAALLLSALGTAATLGADAKPRIGPAQRDADGFLVHEVVSPFQAGPTQIRVLLPDTLLPGERYLVRFAAPGGYSPEKLLTRTGNALTDPASGVAGLHLFTFNQIAETESWRRSLLDRLEG